MILTIFSFVGMRTTRNDEYTKWCYDTLLENDFDPPELHVMRANKNSCVKTKNGVAYIYLVDQGSRDADNKMLVALMAFITSDFYKSDGQYYANLDAMMTSAETKMEFDRLTVKLRS